MYKTEKKPLGEVFKIEQTDALLNHEGKARTVDVFKKHEHQEFVPIADPNYIFDLNLVKVVLLGIATPKFMPLLLWGLHGTGKTSVVEQVCARLNRPYMRVQHTVCTEEADIVGQWTVRNGGTEFQLGPLPDAMRNGWVYLADDWDFGSPAVLSLYQPVLEGKPLVIKNAPHDVRVIKPHPNFRFVATGNTNGAGDETGLYQGTQIQNAANYSRYAVTYKVDYLSEDVEQQVLMNVCGLPEDCAKRLLVFAKEVRNGYINNQLSVPISTRELISVGLILIMSCLNWRLAFELGYINRLSATDQTVVRGYIQRKFAIDMG